LKKIFMRRARRWEDEVKTRGAVRRKKRGVEARIKEKQVRKKGSKQRTLAYENLFEGVEEDEEGP